MSIKDNIKNAILEKIDEESKRLQRRLSREQHSAFMLNDDKSLGVVEGLSYEQVFLEELTKLVKSI